MSATDTGNDTGADSGTGTDDPNIVVVALTYRRPDDLAALLPLLHSQIESFGPRASLLIVDNDPDASARELVEADSGRSRYLHAPKPGIAAARNAALDNAGSADLLVFIDDDERPVAGWLDALVAVWLSTRPTGVVGPVISEFATPPDPWIVAGRYFERRRLPTGSEVAVAATNNLLLDLARIHAWKLRFDERFGLTGGSDTLFTRSITDHGGRLVWCDEAIVTDVVPSARATRQWVTRRAYRSGNSWVLTSMALADSPFQRAAARADAIRRGLVRVVAGAVAVGAGAVLRRVAWRARGVRAVARGSGMVAGSLGRAYVEYRRTV